MCDNSDMSNHSDTSILACPDCKSHVFETGDDVTCNACGRSYSRTGNYTDFAPDIKNSAGLAQRVMENPAITRIYEDVFRPAFTKLGSDVTYADEEKYLRRRFAPANGPVLDLACGTGRYLRILEKQAGARRLIGLDLSDAMLEQAHQKCSVMESSPILFRGSAQELPFKDKSLGGINCFGALHLFPDSEKAVSEAGRCIMPGGVFTCLTTLRTRSPLSSIFQDIFSKKASFRFFTLSEMGKILEGAGFETIDMLPRGMMLMFSARKLSV